MEDVERAWRVARARCVCVVVSQRDVEIQRRCTLGEQVAVGEANELAVERFPRDRQRQIRTDAGWFAGGEGNTRESCELRRRAGRVALFCIRSRD